MNGYECGVCDCNPCVCTERRQRKKIREGKDVLEKLDIALNAPGRRRRKIIMWVFPEIVSVASALRNYCWRDCT